MSSQQPQASRTVGANDASTSRASGSSSSGGNNPSGNKQSGQPLKRACDQCNLRRVKCSHEHPCAHCVRLRINCTYWKAARGKESSGKRIEKLRREQALAAQAQAHAASSSSSSASSNSLSASHAQGSAVGGNGIQQGHNPAAAYPLGSFQHPHHHQHAPVYVGQSKMEDGPGPGSVGVPHSLAPPQTQPSAQYAGPSAHFPAAGHNNHPQARGHDGHRQQGSTSSSHHHHGSTPSSASQASFPREAYQNQQQDTTTSAQATHIPPAVFLGNAFFPPSLTTISPSTAAQFRLPDLSTSLADEFNAQDPNVRVHNFFDWGMGMLGGGAHGQGQHPQAGPGPGPGSTTASAGTHNQRNLSMDSSLPAHLGTDGFPTPSANANTPASLMGGPAGTPHQQQALPNAGQGQGQNARMNLFDWGLGMLAAGGTGAGGAGAGAASGVDASSASVSASPRGDASPAVGAAARTAAAGAGAGSATPVGMGMAAGGVARSRAISFHAGAGDYAVGLQQQLQQRFIQEQQQQQLHQQAAAAAAAGMQQGGGMSAIGGVDAGPSSAAAGGPSTPLPPQGHALPPSLQGVLPSTLSILSGSHPLSESVLLPHIGLYFERLHPIMPVFSRSWIFSKLDRGEQFSDVDFGSMLLAMSALALIQPQEAKERASAEMRVAKARALLEESVRLRNAVLFGQTPTLEATMTSFYVFACLFGLGEDNPAWFRLHEAVALGLLLKLHKPEAYADLQRDEQERRLRAYWLLVITERAYSLQRGHSLGFRGHPEKTTRTLRRQFGLEELEDFPHLQLKLFDAVDEDFVDCWNGRCGAVLLASGGAVGPAAAGAGAGAVGGGAACVRMDRGRALKLWATFQQSEREINDEVLAAEVAASSKKGRSNAGAGLAPLTSVVDQGAGAATATATPTARSRASMSRSEDERQAEFERHKIQLADHRITAQWLLNRLWNLCLTHGHVDLSPSSLHPTTSTSTSAPSSSSSSNSNATPAPFRLDAALRIARKTLAICHELAQAAMEAHGIGLMEKLYDVAMTLVLICRDYPALAKRIGLVDLNLRRGREGGRSSSNVNGGGGGVGRKRVEREGQGYEVVDDDGEEEEEGEGEEGYESEGDRAPAALSPSVPFFYPLENGLSSSSGAGSGAGGGGGNLAHHPHLSMGAVMQQIPPADASSSSSSLIAVKREDDPGGMHAGPGPHHQPTNRVRNGQANVNGHANENHAAGAAPRPPPRPLRQAPTAIESILQEYVEIFRVFRAGDHPFLEKMVLAMKELAQGLPRSVGAAAAAGSAGQKGGVVFAGLPARAQQKQVSVPGQSGQFFISSGPSVSPVAAQTQAHAASTSTSTATAGMQRAAVYTPGSHSGGGGGGTPSYGSGSGSGSGDSGVATVGSGGVLSPTPANVSPGPGPYGLMMPPPSVGGGFHHHHPHQQGQGQGQYTERQHAGSPASPAGVYPSPSTGGGVASPPGRLAQHQQHQHQHHHQQQQQQQQQHQQAHGQGQGGQPGMEWAQLPEDLGCPSFESFLRECGLWDSVGAQGQVQGQGQAPGPGPGQGQGQVN